ncbi:MAG: DUF533 domain-containing protein [Gammaproteobacteria bacterium]|nr:DUF533 domain-containing protein [Gammaproteobacteria bacterium]
MRGLSSFLEQMVACVRTLAHRNEVASEAAPASPSAANMPALGIVNLLIGARGSPQAPQRGYRPSSLADISRAASHLWQQWQATSATALETYPQAGISMDALSRDERDERAEVLLRALLTAAKADGHIDKDEQARIDIALNDMTLDEDILHFLKAELKRPFDIDAVVAAAADALTALEIYVASVVVIDDANDVERDYLARLAALLRLPSSIIDGLPDLPDLASA